MLAEVGRLETVAARDVCRTLVGRNTLVVANSTLTMEVASAAARLATGAGTRLTVEARGREMESTLSSMGFVFVRRSRRGEPTYACASHGASSSRPSSFWSVGEAADLGGAEVPYGLLAEAMDPDDRADAVTEPKSAKAARSYAPLPWQPERWDIGLPAELDAMMARQGVSIAPWQEPGFSEVPFYPFVNDEAVMKSVAEADRALAVGAMEHVPLSEVASVRASSTIHPWTIVDQGGGKWRLCHDYSVGTNRVVATAPFSLPSVWDVAPTVGEGSFFAKYDIRDGFWHCPIAPDSRKRLVVRHPGTGRLMWATRLPFGYLDSPRLFCGLTEAVVARVRKKAVGLGIHLYCFVDDVLIVGKDEAATRAGMLLLEEEFAERGIQWAPHKKRGPCRCIEFLGLLLSNVSGWRGVTITQGRLNKLQAEISRWLDTEDRAGEEKVDLKALASLLGKLVFASQVVPGGRTYMQGMLAAFKGVVVDWRRGTVSTGGLRGLNLELHGGFWRDLRWWARNLKLHSFTPFVKPDSISGGVLTGTDASGWGTGQVLWLHGGREEYVLKFTAAEKRRPINWRELLGIVRVAEAGGERLRGRTVLVEGDNMAAVACSNKLASKSEDMQELMRRLLRLSRRHGFVLRSTHTPGEKLDRPDQTSRGDAAEEPRARVGRRLFKEVETRWGAFDSFLGAEREHGQCSKGGGDGTRLWVHPTFATTGTALRRIGERLEGGAATTTTAVALVPDDDAPQWSSLLRHGLVVGRLGRGSEAVEMSVSGQWRPCRVRRPMRFVLFPRAAGCAVRRLMISHLQARQLDATEGSPRRIAGAGYALTDEGASLRLPVLPGSYAYSLPRGDARTGCLYRACEPNAVELRDDADVMVFQEVRQAASKTAKAMAKARGLTAFEVSDHDARYRADPRELWAVDHLVTPAGGGSTFQRVLFDVEAARVEIEAKQATEPTTEAGLFPEDWVMMVTPKAREAEVTTPPMATPQAKEAEVVVQKTRAAPQSISPEMYERLNFVQSSGGHTWVIPSDSPPELETRARDFLAEVEQDLHEASAGLASLHLSQSQVKSGPEGQITGREFRVTHQAETMGDRSGGVQQPCPYAGIPCAGCRNPFTVGDQMESHLDALVCPVVECRELHQARVARELAREPGATTYYGLYSDTVGASGVYTEQAEVQYWIDQDDADEEGTTFSEFETAEAAREFVKSMTAARAARSLTAPRVEAANERTGSTTKRSHLAEKLAPQRIEKIACCVAGNCGIFKDASNSTACLGGCGVRLHIVSCAEMGRGYAALGNFTCPKCRLAKQVADEETIPSEEMTRVTLRTMVLELGQGAEATAGSYASFTAWEEEYVKEMGGDASSGQLLLPRHNPECFKGFLTWFCTDKERARSAVSMVRSAGAFLVKLKLSDVTKDGSVKAHLRELVGELGVEAEPATTATPRMLKLMTEPGGVIDTRYPQPTIAPREKFQVVAEGQGGCRICEVVGAGEGHGLLANDTAILENPASGEVVVELHLEHSKTGFKRTLNLAGKTRTSGVETAKILESLWKVNKLEKTTSMQAGIKVTRPDFMVLRVSLLGLNGEVARQKLYSTLRRSNCASAREHARTSETKGNSRAVASGTGSQAKKYINVAGGTSGDASMRNLKDQLVALGYVAQIVKGPLMRATTGGKYPKMTLMPFTVSSAFAPTKELLEKAHVKAGADPNDPDPDLDLSAGKEPSWSTHSLRRLADTVARRDREETGTSEDEIDIYFGWHEKILLREMQVHYASMSIRERMKQARITGLL